MGASWRDAAHQFLFADEGAPFDRSETNGFRLAKYLGTDLLPDLLTRAVESPSRDYSTAKPVSDQLFEVFASMYDYDPQPLDARIESTQEAQAWVREKVSIRAASGNERMTAFLFLPKNANPPFKTVVFAPGAGTIQARMGDPQQMQVIDFLMVSGRAVLYPIYKGTHDRNTGQTSPWPDQTRAYQDWMIQVVNDARRAVDYLAGRNDVQHETLAYYGFSWGSYFGARVLALESRFKSSVLLDGGFQANPPPAIDSLNFAPHVKIPVIMINGNADFIFPVESAQRPMFAQLGTSSEHKRHVIFTSGHGVINQQRSQVVKEVLDWLDRYQGPVQRRSAG